MPGSTNNASGGLFTYENLQTVCVRCCRLIYSGRQVCGLPAGVTQEEEDHTGFLHLPSAVLALIFLARRIQPFLSLVVKSNFVCTNDFIVLYLLVFVFFMCTNDLIVLYFLLVFVFFITFYFFYFFHFYERKNSNSCDDTEIRTHVLTSKGFEFTN